MRLVGGRPGSSILTRGPASQRGARRLPSESPLLLLLLLLPPSDTPLSHGPPHIPLLLLPPIPLISNPERERDGERAAEGWRERQELGRERARPREGDLGRERARPREGESET